MPSMKLPYLRQRSYTNRQGVTWTGWYFEPPRGADGKKGKTIPLGSDQAAALAAYAKLTGSAVVPPPL